MEAEMSTRNSNVRKLKSQPKPQLTSEEVQRLAEKLAVAVEHDSEEIALLMLLFTHLENQPDRVDVVNEIYTIKKYLFVGTNEADNAQDKFQSHAYANRGKLLQWPNERGTK
jgi:hypothetical protein